MSNVRRVYVEKKGSYDVQQKALAHEIRNYLGIKDVDSVRVLIRYDVENVSDETFEKACNGIFSEPPVDTLYKEEFQAEERSKIFSVEFLPGQFDQRADSAEQCIRFIKEDETPVIRTAVTYVIEGNISEEEFEAIKNHCINPVDSREAAAEKPETLVTVFEEPADVKVFDGFKDMPEAELKELYDSLGLAMTFKDFQHIQKYYHGEEDRNPTMTEIRVLDTYWSDHCRHTTFSTELKDVKFDDGDYRDAIEDTYKEYLKDHSEIFKGREDKFVCLMDLALMAMRKLKKEGKLKKIIVTSCMAQRYKDDVLHELPEVDAVLGTGSYGEIARAVDEVMAPGGLRPCYMGDIQNCVQGGARILSTPSWYAYLRIAEGCDNCCAYCVIPRLRGRYRSRPMNELLDEASELASAGVKELIVIAQDITRYGTDLNGEHQLAALLRELCKLDFHWIRLHYLYPDDITDELIDTIAQEEKIVPYLDIPIQHCNDDILKAMNRRDTKESIRKVFHDLRARIPGLVLRTSIIAGLPGEGEKEFEELCDFLREEKIERAGVFPFSPEEGTKAATMEHVPMEEAQRRTELLVDVQSVIIDEYNESVLGDVREVLCEGWSEEAQSFVGRSYAESVDIDGKIYFSAERDIMAGEFVNVRLTGTMDGELTGEAVE